MIRCFESASRSLGGEFKRAEKAYGDIVNRVLNSNGGIGTKRTQLLSGESTPVKKQKYFQGAYGIT